MFSLLCNRITIIWLMLLGITMLTWKTGNAGSGVAGGLPGSVVLVVAFIKVRWVLLDFMEVRHAPRLLRVLVECWVVLLCAILVALL
jgi:hypothetical protein